MLFKKGAMFGLESRAFKKQFGELFLARMHSVTPKEAHGAHIQTKRGAMFGLDARIALAIFGALSVISGAALYSAIKDAREQRVITSILEVSKAVEAYYLDTGFLPSVSQYSTTILDILELLENTDNVAGWRGPYYSAEIFQTDTPPDAPRLKFYSGCNDDLSSMGIPEPGYAMMQLRDLGNPDFATKKNIRVHVQCIPNEMAETIAQRFNGKDVASSTPSDIVYFNDYGDGSHKQLYYTVMILDK
jgi:hypothetical protein